MLNYIGYIPLTPKEEEVYNFMLEGFTPKEIASVMVLAECTIKTHIAHIFQKKNVYSTQQLLAERIKELEGTIRELKAA